MHEANTMMGNVHELEDFTQVHSFQTSLLFTMVTDIVFQASRTAGGARAAKMISAKSTGTLTQYNQSHQSNLSEPLTRVCLSESVDGVSSPGSRSPASRSSTPNREVKKVRTPKIGAEVFIPFTAVKPAVQQCIGTLTEGYWFSRVVLSAVTMLFQSTHVTEVIRT